MKLAHYILFFKSYTRTINPKAEQSITQHNYCTGIFTVCLQILLGSLLCDSLSSCTLLRGSLLLSGAASVSWAAAISHNVLLRGDHCAGLIMIPSSQCLHAGYCSPVSGISSPQAPETTTTHRSRTFIHFYSLSKKPKPPNIVPEFMIPDGQFCDNLTSARLYKSVSLFRHYVSVSQRRCLGPAQYYHRTRHVMT